MVSYNLFTGLALLLLRGARSLPRYAAYAFATLAVSQFASLVVVAVRGFGVAGAGAFGFAFLNDALFTVVRVIAFVLAAGAVYTERGVFVRTRRTT